MQKERERSALVLKAKSKLVALGSKTPDARDGS